MAYAPVSRARWQATLAFAGSSVLWWRFGGTAPAIIVICTAGFATLAWLAPHRYEPIQRGLDFITRLILSGFSWFALSIVFFGLFTPLHVWRRLIRSDPLNLRPASTATTYLQPLPPPDRRRFDRQF